MDTALQVPRLWSEPSAFFTQCSIMDTVLQAPWLWNEPSVMVHLMQYHGYRTPSSQAME